MIEIFGGLDTDRQTGRMTVVSPPVLTLYLLEDVGIYLNLRLTRFSRSLQPVRLTPAIFDFGQLAPSLEISTVQEKTLPRTIDHVYDRPLIIPCPLETMNQDKVGGRPSLDPYATETTLIV